MYDSIQMDMFNSSAVANYCTTFNFIYFKRENDRAIWQIVDHSISNSGTNDLSFDF